MKACRQSGLVFAVLVALAGSARAQDSPASKSLHLGASLETQNLLRTPAPDTWQFIQQRNTVRLLADLSLLKDNNWQGPFSFLPKPDWLESAGGFLLYRGVYDSVYDINQSIPSKTDYRGLPVPPPSSNFNDLSSATRDALKYENRLREAYVDLDFADGFMVRAGRQQIVWGVSDGFRVLDRANSLDLTWHQFQSIPPTDESFDEIRVPTWMLLMRKNGLGFGDDKGSFAEVYWNPGDWNPNKVGFLPTPWGAQLANPLLPPGSTQQITLQNGTQLGKQGDYTRDPAGNSQVGVRIGTDRQLCDQLTNCKLQGNLVYMYHRFTPWGGASTSAASLFQNTGATPGLEFNAPYIHTLGLSLSYTPTLQTGITYPIPSAASLFQQAYRLESTIDFGVPYYHCGEGWTPSSGPQRCLPPGFDQQLPPTKNHTLWSGVLGADFLDPAGFGRFALSGQFFWTYLLDDDAKTLGSLDLPNFFSSTPTGGFQDDVRRWEVVTTLTPTMWFYGGRVRASMSYLLDWVNSYSQEAAWALGYTIYPGLMAELSQRFFINPKHEVNYEPWGLGGLNRGRSETGIRLRYELPTVAY